MDLLYILITELSSVQHVLGKKVWKLLACTRYQKQREVYIRGESISLGLIIFLEHISGGAQRKFAS